MKKKVDVTGDLDRTRQKIDSSKKDGKITQKRMKIMEFDVAEIKLH